MHKDMKFRDVLDGLSNTIAMMECATDLGDRDIRTTLVTPTPPVSLGISKPDRRCRLQPELCRDSNWISPTSPHVLVRRNRRWHDPATFPDPVRSGTE